MQKSAPNISVQLSNYHKENTCITTIRIEKKNTARGKESSLLFQDNHHTDF